MVPMCTHISIVALLQIHPGRTASHNVPSIKLHLLGYALALELCHTLAVSHPQFIIQFTDSLWRKARSAGCCTTVNHHLTTLVHDA